MGGLITGNRLISLHGLIQRWIFRAADDAGAWERVTTQDSPGNFQKTEIRNQKPQEKTWQHNIEIP
jgi:hypothetical protein